MPNVEIDAARLVGDLGIENYDTAFAGAGELTTGAGATATGTNGGFDIYATYTVGAAGSQGTQGQAVFILQYISPNDGSCVNVPLGATAAAC